MPRFRRLRPWAVVAACVVTGCSISPHRREHPKPNPVILGQLTQDKLHKALRLKVERRLEYLNAHRDTYQAQVITTMIDDERYYFRYYDVFPDDWSSIHVEVKPIEDSDPLVANWEGTVTFPRVRYETLYATSADRIRTTNNFVRDEGTEQEHYKFTGQVWEFQDGFFDVKRTSVYRDNEWVEVPRRIRRVEEKQPEYFIDKIANLFGFLR